MALSEEYEFRTIVSGSPSATTAVMIVHDWFGITDMTRASVRRLGDKGIRAMAIDLYRGHAAETHQQAQELMDALDEDYAQEIILASLKDLSADGRPVAIIGYSLGGSIALRTAINHPNLIIAAASIYGGGYNAADDAALKTAGPILMITGSADSWAYPEQMSFEERMWRLGNPIESYVYPGAEHAFAQPLYNSGANYDLMATRAMHTILDDFLNRRLSPEKMAGNVHNL